MLGRQYFLFTCILLVISWQSEKLQANQQLPADNHDTQEDQDDPKAQYKQSGSPNGALEWITNKRNDWGKLIGDTGRRLDGFFASDEAIERSNDSFIKLALIGKHSKGGSSKLEPRFKFRLDLPTLEERLKIVFESEADETRTLADKSGQTGKSVNNDISESAVGALKLVAKKARKWKASASVGVDLQIPPDYFWRSKIYYRWQLAEQWNLDAQQKIYYFHKDGWGETTSLTFQRTGDFVVFRSSSQAKYLHKDRRTEFSQTWSFLKALSPIRAINFQFGILGENKPKAQVTNYFLNTIYRRKLSKEWLFYEMIPALWFPRDDHFKATPSISAKIEIVFSSD